MAERSAPTMSGPVDSVSHVPGVDTIALSDWLLRNLPWMPVSSLRVSPISGGRSNLTYHVDGGPRPLVLRRPPLGHVLETAHDMRREYRVMKALAGTGVPVPRVVALCTDESVLGAPFYLMEKVAGVVHRSADDLRRLGADPGRGRGRLLGYAITDVLSDLHSVDPQAVGLADFGRPEGFMARQLKRWQGQLESSRTRDLPGIGELADRLTASLPVSPRPAIVHGDYRLDNVMADRSDPTRIAAVLDWEMAALGDPLSDVGMFCVYWDGLAGLGEAVPPAPGCLPGWPTRQELVERYAARSGAEVGELAWYVAFAFFKIAVILEGIRYRHLQGSTADSGFEAIADAVPVLAERGHTALDGRS